MWLIMNIPMFINFVAVNAVLTVVVTVVLSKNGNRTQKPEVLISCTTLALSCSSKVVMCTAPMTSSIAIMSTVMVTMSVTVRRLLRSRKNSLRNVCRLPIRLMLGWLPNVEVIRLHRAGLDSPIWNDLGSVLMAMSLMTGEPWHRLTNCRHVLLRDLQHILVISG